MRCALGKCYDAVTSPLFYSSLYLHALFGPTEDISGDGKVSCLFNLACFHLDLMLTARYENQHYRYAFPLSSV